MSKKHSLHTPAQFDPAQPAEQQRLADTIKSRLTEGRSTAAPAIRQGVKATVETVPVPVRLEVEQVHMLKMLAALERKTVSGIIRECVAEYISRRAGSAERIEQTVREEFGPPTKP